MKQLHLVVSPTGVVCTLYDESVDLTLLGNLSITRASHVEPAPSGRWLADLAPVNGPLLGPFHHRSEALQAERAWLLAELL